MTGCFTSASHLLGSADHLRQIRHLNFAQRNRWRITRSWLDHLGLLGRIRISGKTNDRLRAIDNVRLRPAASTTQRHTYRVLDNTPRIALTGTCRPASDICSWSFDSDVWSWVQAVAQL